MISNLKIFRIILLRAGESWYIVGLVWFNNYFAFITWEKLHFYLIASFYYFLVKEV